tara:strand:+ start:304 stop:486 length:183 start_codon:yes stop_codon:yes gene_type:complete
VGSSERAKEIRRRRQRKQKLQKLEAKFKKSSGEVKSNVLDKVRSLTPGYETIYENWGVEK